jgi:hypothetical protein
MLWNVYRCTADLIAAMDRKGCKNRYFCNHGIVALEKKMQLYVIPTSHVDVNYGPV